MEGDEAELRGEVAGGAQIADKGSVAAVGVVFGVSVGTVHACRAVGACP